MRKATGKVVSLVLALALVITSFSATFASAATKTESGEASSDNGTVYLSNTNGVDSASDNMKSFNLSAWVLKGAKLETYDHIEISSLKIYSVSVSGDSIIRVTENEDDEYIATVRNEKGTGTATVNVLYEGTADRGDDEITVRGSKKFTVNLIDAATPILGATGASAGEEVSEIANLQKNPEITTDGAYLWDDDDNAVTYKTAAVYLPSPSTNDTEYAAGDDNQSALASYTAQQVIAVEEDKVYDTSSGASVGLSGGVTKDNYEDVYVITTSGSNDYLSVDTNGKSFTYGVGDPSVGNTVRVTVSSLKEGDTQSEFVLNKTVDQATAKVENKVVGSFDEVFFGDASKAVVGLSTNPTTLSKSKVYVQTSAKITESADRATVVYWDVTGANIETDASGELTIEGGRIGDVSADNDVKIEDGTIGAVTTDGDVEVIGGSVTSIDEGANVTVEGGATVGSVSADTKVTVSDGVISGEASAPTVEVKPTNDEETASVGSVKSASLTIDSTYNVAKVGSYVANSASSNAVVVTGEKTTLGGIDADYYPLTINMVNFVGTLPAPENAYDTGYDPTGTVISSNDDDDETATRATISGNVNVEGISLESGAVTFAGKVTVDEVLGGEADFIINAGALTINDLVSTSNTLKIADAADVKAGTLVFTAASDIADVDSFVRYGYELKVVNGTTTDGFVIDSVNFAGLTLDVGSSIELTVGETAVVTASAYPNGTQLPEGTKIEFYLNGDLNYIEGENLGNNQASVTALKYSEDFDVLNKGTLTAVVLDEYDIQLEEYGEAVCDITVVKTKAPTETYKSDTTGDVVVAKGNTYQFKITSLNGQTPSVVLGSDGVFELVGTSVEGSDYFFKFQAVGASGAATGVYVNGDAKVATLYVDGNTGYTCDTTTVNVPAGGTYQVKITAASMPTLLPGNSIYTVAFASQEGNDYFFKITATSAQAGDVVGFYINGGARAFVATTV